MRPARALWAYLFFVFVGAALIAPWVHHLLQAMAQVSALQGLAGIPFRRIVDRCLLALALIGLWPLVKCLGIRSAAEIGLRRDPKIGAQLGRGLTFGSILLLLAAGASIAAGAAQWDAVRPVSSWPKQILSAALSAVVVAFMEELLFRGAIFTALRRASTVRVALWGSSAIYGIVHFLAKAESPAVIEWTSGFVVLGRMLRGFVELQTVLPGFFSLTLLGIIFALALQKSGALYLSMGIHAALIFWVKLFAFATNPAPGANLWFWGTPKLVDGWFCFLLLMAATAWFARQPGKTHEPARPA